MQFASRNAQENDDKQIRHALLIKVLRADIRFAFSGSKSHYVELFGMLRSKTVARIAVELGPDLLNKSNGYISVRNYIGTLHPELLEGAKSP